MPRPRQQETESEYVKRAIPMLMHEGHTQHEAVGKAYGMYESYKKKARKKK